MYVTSVEEVETQALDMEGARGVKVQYLLHEGVGAKKIAVKAFHDRCRRIHRA